ncbi:MAG: class I SAM-dependent methyltransferase [Fimbriimonas ginsengisoli]|uniref:Class I SAM-dependent methyltransferase n=1 Tax=Fimbriimonas ginsengisoli TaxID=1005039 RepID=A0A931PU14_FIMGI|nr:class I SAM-dependent methyltransferase [Fimbriimonas ginsengisoli]
MKQVPYRMWVGYYLLLLSQQDVHPKTILDVACGTGSMAELLAREGFQVEGIDVSAPMIAQARRKAKRKRLPLQYHVADAAEFDLGKRFDAAFSYFDSLNNIVEPERLQEAFRRIARHLSPGGSFIFDLNTEYAFENKMFDQKRLHANAKLRYQWEGHYDPKSRLIRVDMRFWLGDEEFEETHWQRAYRDQDIRRMLLQAGFTQIQAFHSYTLEPTRPRSDRVHYACLLG